MYKKRGQCISTGLFDKIKRQLRTDQLISHQNLEVLLSVLGESLFTPAS